MVYVWAAYSIVLVFIFLYSWMLGRRQQNLMEEVAMLKKMLEKNAG